MTSPTDNPLNKNELDKLEGKPRDFELERLLAPILVKYNMLPRFVHGGATKEIVELVSTHYIPKQELSRLLEEAKAVAEWEILIRVDSTFRTRNKDDTLARFGMYLTQTLRHAERNLPESFWEDRLGVKK